MRGGLDDALDKLARRDELRRRAAGEAPATPPAVTELVEAVAAVVARHPELAITMGVEGAGDPTLLHFALDNGIVQVSADSTVAARTRQDRPSSTPHVDFDIDPEVADGPVTGTGGRESGGRPHPYDAARQYQATGSYDPEPYDEPYDPQAYEPVRYASDPYEQGPDTARTAEQPRYTDPEPPPRAMPTPLPEPIPLRMEPGATELAAKRLAALLREDPSLLHPTPRD